MTKQLKKNTKNNDQSKKKIVILVVLIIILLLLLGGCSIYRSHRGSKREQEKGIIEVTKEYMKENGISTDETITIPFAELSKDLLDKYHVEDACIQTSYVVVTKVEGTYTYEPKWVCEESKLQLNGESKVEVEVGKPYEEEGATSSNGNVTISGEPDTSKPGTYFVKYEDDEDVVIRVVEVVDKEKPVITLNGGETVYVNLYDVYTEPGYTAKDNVDGDLTDKVSVVGFVNASSVGTYLRYYSVKDASGNETMVTRTVIVRKEAPILTLKGVTAVELEVGTPYVEAGYVAKDSKDGDITRNVTVRGSVNSNKVGTYVLTYQVTNSRNGVSTTTRTVVVKDSTVPEITLNGPEVVHLNVGVDTYVEQGATATDNYDGDVTDRIKITGVYNFNKLGTYVLNYKVTDANGNQALVKRTIMVEDHVAPTISLNGDAVIYMNVNRPFVDPGVTITDNYSKNIQPKIDTNLDATKLGMYTVKYTATDEAGNEVSVTRTIVVEDKEAPKIVLNGAAEVSLEKGTEYQELGAIATDNYSKNVTVMTSGAVDSNTVGTYTITYTAVDEAGNVSAATRIVTVADTTAPTIMLESDQVNSYVSVPEVSMTITDASDLQSVTYAWNDDVHNITVALGTKVDVPFDRTNSDGTYTLTVTATDMYGNTSTKQIGTFKKDTTAPEVTFIPETAIGQVVVTELHVTDNLSGVKEVTYAWADNNTTAPSADAFKPYENNKLTLTEDGTYYLWVKAVDEAGNETLKVSLKYVVDNKRPTITFRPDERTVTTEASVEVVATAYNGKTIQTIEYVWTTSTTEPTEGWTSWDNYADDPVLKMRDEDGTYYLWVRVEDSYGLTAIDSSNAFVLDNTFPELTISPENMNDTKKVDIEVNVVEAHDYEVSYAFTTSDTFDATKLVAWTDFTSGDVFTKDSVDGTYYFQVRVIDEAGNTTDQVYGPYIMDNTAPETPVISYNEDWTKEDLIVTITGTDTVQYKIDDGEWTDYDATAKVVLTENATIVVRSKDAAGNISAEASQDVTNIDKEVPTLSVSKDQLDLGTKIDITLQVKDTISGVEEIAYGFSTDADTEPSYDTTISSFTVGDHEVTGTITKNDVSGTHYVWIQVTDQAGNVTKYKTDAFIIDVEAPEITLNPEEDEEPTSKQDVTVTITDNATIDQILYVWSTESSADNVEDDWTSWNDYSETNQVLTLQHVNGYYYLYVKAIDEAGNETLVQSKKYLVTTAAPTVVFNPNVTEDYAQSVSVQVDVTSEYTTIEKIEYAFVIDKNALPATFDEMTSGATATLDSVTGAYYMCVRVTDNLDGGRENEVVCSEGTYSLDNEEPDVVFHPNGSIGIISTARVSATILDAHSGVRDIKYAWSTSNTTEPTEWTSYESGTELERTAEFETDYLWIKAEDEAGNVATVVSDAFVLDNAYPEVEITMDTTHAVQEITANITATGKFGKDVQVYTIWSTDDGLTKEDELDWVELTAPYEVTYGAGKNSEEYLYVKVEDANGLVSMVRSDKVIFDNTNSEVTLNPSSITEVTKDVTVFVTVEEAHPLKVFYYWSKTETEDFDSYAEWTGFMYNSQDKQSFLEDNVEGTYYLHIKVEDEAGNTTSVVGTYEIDRKSPEAPMITASTEDWTNENVMITITGDDTLEYKIGDGSYQTYTDALEITKNTTITVRSKDAVGNTSEEVVYDVTNIDKTADTIKVDYPTALTNHDFSVKVITKKTQSPIEMIRWATGTFTKEEMRTKGYDITAKKAFTNGMNRHYTIYVRDKAGNESILTGEITNIDKEAPVVTLNGDDVVVVPIRGKYEELGATVTDNHDVGLVPTIVGEVDTTTIGVYTITYTAVDEAGNTAVPVTRTVRVVDNVKPTIELVGDAVITLEVGSTFTDLGAIVKDNYDPDQYILGNGIVKTDVVGDYTVVYRAMDSSMNAADDVTRIIHVVDSTKPTITLHGDQMMTLEVGSTYVEAGASVYDLYDGELTPVITGSVDTTTVGTYELVYTVTDSAGNTASVTRTVQVVDHGVPTITLNGDATITIPVGTAFVDPGVVVTDNYDASLVPVVTGEVDHLVAGTYNITYKVTDSSNNVASITRTVVVEKASFRNAFTDVTCEETGSCYSNAVTEDNYVWYSGYLWRMVKVNADGSMKLVTEENISALSFAEGKEGGVFAGSIMEKWLRETFYPSLHFADTIVKPNDWCTNVVDGTATENPCTTTVSSSVGMLTIDEYNKLGGAEGFLHTGDVFYTLSGDGKKIWVVKDNGTAGLLSTNFAYGVRPSVVIQASNVFASGDGTKAHPYRMEADTIALTDSTLNQRYSGEYVSFANHVWRIVSTDANGTKLVLDSYVTDVDGRTIRSEFGQNTYFNVNTGIGALLNTSIYQRMFQDVADSSKLLETVWYDSLYEFGYNPMDSSLLLPGNFSQGYLGLLKVGEILAGQSATLNNQGLTYWTMSHTASGTAWYISTGGMAYAEADDAKRALRPVIKINSTVTIQSGSGTVEDPYILH